MLIDPHLPAKARRFLASFYAGVLCLASSCHMLPDPAGFVVFPEAHARNLEELHKADGSYSYSGRILGDWGYIVEEVQGGDRVKLVSESRIASPSAETIENLVQLLSAKHSDPEARAQQLQWCTRLIQGDESELVRTIAAEGLKAIGLHLGLKTISLQDPERTPASPDDLANVFEDLLREIRLGVESDSHDTSSFAALCTEASKLDFDLSGARRLHGIATGLLQLEMLPACRVNLQSLVLGMEVKLVEIGLFEALIDSSDQVAAAGLDGFVEIEGPARLIPLLTRTQNSLTPELQLSLLRLIRGCGLPAGMNQDLRERCINSIMGLSTAHPSARVRVQGMLALGELIPDGPDSLREEDWMRWYDKASAKAQTDLAE
jgi:hypothetical protein